MAAILTNAQLAAFQRAEAAANDNRPLLEFLKALAEADPRLADRVQELEQRLEYLTLVSKTALELNRTLS